MKLSHDFFFRLVVAVGCIGSAIHGIQVLFIEPHTSFVPWYGIFGFITALCFYGFIWAITPEKWWKD